MKFESAYAQMLKGAKIKRPCFQGYWYIDGYDGKMKIHLRTGEEITQGELDLTVRNCLAEDWEIYSPDSQENKKIEKFNIGNADYYIGNTPIIKTEND